MVAGTELASGRRRSRDFEERGGECWERRLTGNQLFAGLSQGVLEGLERGPDVVLPAPDSSQQLVPLLHDRVAQVLDQAPYELVPRRPRLGGDVARESQQDEPRRRFVAPLRFEEGGVEAVFSSRVRSSCMSSASALHSLSVRSRPS